LDAAAIGHQVSDADEEGTAAAVFDDAGKVLGPVVAEVNRAADRAQ